MSASCDRTNLKYEELSREHEVDREPQYRDFEEFLNSVKKEYDDDDEPKVNAVEAVTPFSVVVVGVYDRADYMTIIYRVEGDNCVFFNPYFDITTSSIGEYFYEKFREIREADLLIVAVDDNTNIEEILLDCMCAYENSVPVCVMSAIPEMSHFLSFISSVYVNGKGAFDKLMNEVNILIRMQNAE
jgi:hypothetical protein